MEKVASKEVNYFEGKERKIKEKKKEQIKKPNRKFDFQTPSLNNCWNGRFINIPLKNLKSSKMF